MNEHANLRPVEPIFNISLFSGYGGLDKGVAAALPGLRTVAYVEREAFAVAALVAQMEDDALDSAPVFTDVTAFDGKRFADELLRVTGRRVRSITGGFPCQDISLAGKGVGITGERSGLWFAMRDIIRDVRPDVVFLENVAAITRRGMSDVLGSLADIGYDAEWLCLRASDVGAPHGRNRWFCLGVADAASRGDERPDIEAGLPLQLVGVDSQLADAASARRSGSEDARADRGDARQVEGRCQEPERGGDALEYAAGVGRGEGRAEPVIRSWRDAAPDAGRIHHWPPGPADSERWADAIATRPWLAPATVGPVRRVVDGCPAGDELCLCPRAARLRLLGNGVVPAQAAFAFTTLMARCGTCYNGAHDELPS